MPNLINVKHYVKQTFPEPIVNVLRRFYRCLFKRKSGEKLLVADSVFLNMNAHQLLSWWNHNEEPIFSSIEEVEMAIRDEKVKVVSFDIFDTLICRSVVRPFEIFELIGRDFNLPHFAEARIKAEEVARERHLGAEITLNDIYEELSSEFTCFKEIEIEYELNNCFGYEYGQKLFNLARKLGKKIVLLSDMYLPLSVVLLILKKSGIQIESENVLVSSELNKTKRDGDLFSYLLHRFSLRSDEVVHIGDNFDADCLVPKKFGINSFHIPSVFERCIVEAEFLALIRSYAAHRTLETSQILGQFARSKTEKLKKDFWSDFGFIYGGPLVLSYSKLIRNRCKEFGIQQLLFVARDGYIVKKVLSLLDEDLELYYVYANRKLNLITSLEIPKNNDLIRSKIKGLNVAGADLIVHNAYEQNFKELKTNLRAQEILKRNVKFYASYIDKLNLKDEKTAIVDATTLSFSAFNLLSKFVKLDHCFYTLCLGDVPENATVFAKGCLPLKYSFMTTLSEVFLSAPEPTVTGISSKGEICFAVNDNHSNIVHKIQSGEMLFVKNVMECKTPCTLFSDFNMWCAWCAETLMYWNEEELKKLDDYHFEDNELSFGLGSKLKEWKQSWL